MSVFWSKYSWLGCITPSNFWNCHVARSKRQFFSSLEWHTKSAKKEYSEQSGKTDDDWWLNYHGSLSSNACHVL